MNINNLCMGCMRENQLGSSSCPNCGYDENIEHNKVHQLETGSVLQGRYLVGKSLGEGGFGITYIGFDLRLEIRVAIKEFFPFGCVSRNATQSFAVVPGGGDKGNFFYSERQKFLNEARVLAGFDEQQGIVNVKDYFEENNTAYIVMEYLEGITVKQYINENGGKCDEQTVLSLFKPVITSLIKIHEKGLIHRDISLDNIIITKKNKVKLLDFGAAYDYRHSGKEMVVMYKKGYSPIEQMSEGGKLGTYTDVYALCAAMYLSLTGKLPPSAIDRSKGKEIDAFSELGVPVNPLTEAAIMKGLELNPSERVKNAEDLYYFLFQYNRNPNASTNGLDKAVKKSSTEVIAERIKEENDKSKVRKIIILISLAIFFIAICLMTLSKHKEINGENSKDVYSGRSVVSSESGLGTLNTTTNSEIVSEKARITQEDINRVVKEFYEELNRKRDGNSVRINSEYENAARYFVDKAVKENHDTADEWNDAYQNIAAGMFNKYDLITEGWQVIPYHDGLPETTRVVLDFCNVVESYGHGDYAVTLTNCESIGVAAGVHEDGTVFFSIVFM